MERDETIRRTTDGAIDIGHYLMRGRSRRSREAWRIAMRWRRLRRHEESNNHDLNPKLGGART